MKKWNKLFLGLGSLSAVVIPIVTVVSCERDVYTGPRGGTYHLSPSGNREYFGNNSGYHHH